MNSRLSFHMISMALMLLFSSSLIGQSYFNALFMNQLGLTHSRDVALAGANTTEYSTAMNTFSNPANQARLEGLHFSGSFGAITVSEDRSFPAIDQFGDVVTNNIYVVSKGIQNTFSSGVSWGNGRLAASLASVPFQSPHFTFKEEVRGSLYAPNINRDPLIGYHHQEQAGVVQATGASVSMSLKSWSIGLSARMLHGINLENTRGVSVLDSSDVSPLAAGENMLTSETWDLDNTPLVFNAGFIKDLGLHWRIGASYQSGYSLESTRHLALPGYSASLGLPYLAWSNHEFEFSVSVPARLEVGLRMKPTNALATSVFVSMAYQDWAKYEVSYTDSIQGISEPFAHPMREAFTINGGIEHWVSEHVPFRAGFSWIESPLDADLSRSVFSGGSGWRSGPLQFDVAVQLSSVGYRYFDIFVPVSMSPNAYENVRESQTNYSISVSYSL